jgi:hypothetical protein
LVVNGRVWPSVISVPVHIAASTAARPAGTRTRTGTAATSASALALVLAPLLFPLLDGHLATLELEKLLYQVVYGVDRLLGDNGFIWAHASAMQCDICWSLDAKRWRS